MGSVGRIGGSSDVMKYVARSQEKIKQSVQETQSKMQAAKERSGKAVEAMLNASVTVGGTGANLNVLA